MLKIQGLLIFYKYVTLTIWVIDITRITNVFKTLKLWKNLNNLSQPLSLAALVKGMMIYPRKEKNTAVNAK